MLRNEVRSESHQSVFVHRYVTSQLQLILFRKDMGVTNEAPFTSRDITSKDFLPALRTWQFWRYFVYSCWINTLIVVFNSGSTPHVLKSSSKRTPKSEIQSAIESMPDIYSNPYPPCSVILSRNSSKYQNLSIQNGHIFYD